MLQDNGSPSNSIELLGGNPQFVVRCLQSDLGKGVSGDFIKETNSLYEEEPGYYTKHVWNNITNKDWADTKCVLSIIYSIDEHPSYSHFGDIVIMTIECRDNNGKNLLQWKSKSRDKILKYIKDKLFYSYAYVNSSNGIVVRKEPSLTSSVVYQLKDKSKVILKEKTSEIVEITKGNSIIKSYWTKVYIDEKITGYVADTFLIPWYAIHPDELYDAYTFKFIDSLTMKSHYYTCYEYSQPGDFAVHYWKDTLSSYLKLELVNEKDYLSKKVNNKYTLDTRKIGTPASPSSGWVNNSAHSVKLPINNGKDSIHIQDEPAEYPRVREYVGRFPFYNRYLVYTYSFGDSYELYDMKTGNKESIEGIPYISPDGKYRIDFKHDSDPEYFEANHSGILSISKFDKNYRVISNATINFSYWVPDETPNSAFWISNNELIIRTYNINSIFSPYTMNYSQRDQIHYNYIKLTIK